MPIRNKVISKNDKLNKLDKLNKNTKNKDLTYNDIIVVILNCKKYKHKREKQLNSWIKKIPKKLKYFHIIGDENLKEKYKIDKEENIIYVNCKDDYLSLPKKVIIAYQAIEENFDYKYVFKTDDDQNIKEEFWDLIINNLNPAINYGGQFVMLKKDTKIEPAYQNMHRELPIDLLLQKTIYCGGRFYLLSRTLVLDLISKKELFVDKIIEDHSVGLLMEKKLQDNALYFNINNYFETKF